MLMTKKGQDFSRIGLFIPTKGRMDCQKSYKIYKSLGLNPILVIEPQEEHLAKKYGYNYILLPENNRGLLFSRNYILNYAREKNIEYLVMSDDDINSFSRTNFNTHRLMQDNSAFLDALDYFIKIKSCGGIEYSQFAWSATKPVSFYKGFQVVHLLYMPIVPKKIKYETFKDDKDMSIQLIFSGIKTFTINFCSLSVPSIGTNKGGLNEEYASQKDNIGSLELYKKYGADIIKLKKKENGRIDADPNWQKIKKLVGGK